MTKRKDRIPVDKRKHPISDTFICHDCAFVFSIHTKIQSPKKKISCPYCSDFVNVIPYVERPKKSRRPWTEEEKLLIERIIKGELQKYQVAAMTGRTYGSVQKKVEKQTKEMKN